MGSHSLLGVSGRPKPSSYPPCSCLPLCKLESREGATFASGVCPITASSRHTGKMVSLGYLWAGVLLGSSSTSFWHQAWGERVGICGVESAVSHFRQGHVEELWGLAAHPSRAQFVTCGQDKLVRLWSVESRQPVWSRTIEVRALEPHTPFQLERLRQCVSASGGDHTRAV